MWDSSIEVISYTDSSTLEIYLFMEKNHLSHDGRSFLGQFWWSEDGGKWPPCRTVGRPILQLVYGYNMVMQYWNGLWTIFAKWYGCVFYCCSETLYNMTFYEMVKMNKIKDRCTRRCVVWCWKLLYQLQVYSWGQNAYGQLGHNENEASPNRVKVGL